jgi:hypothetical protein
MNLSALDNLLWAAGFLGHVALLFVLLIRRRWEQFPILTCFAAYEAMVTITLFLVSRYGSQHAYTITYWVFGAGDILFQLGLIFEISRVVLRPTGSWVRDARSSFVIGGVIGTAIAVGLCLAVKPLAHSTLGIWEIRGNLFTALLDCELFLAMLYAANRLGLEWRNHVMAMAQGVTAWAFGALVSDLAHIVLGWTGEFHALDYSLSFLYVAVLGYWIVSFWRPETVRAPLSEEMKDYLVALHRRVQYDLQQVTQTRDRT